MRIIMIVHRMPLNGGAGAENYTRTLCLELSVRHQIAVITMSETPDALSSYATLKMITDKPFPVYAFTPHNKNADSLEKNYLNNDFDSDFRAFCKKFRPDIIHVQHVIGLSISLISTASFIGTPVIMTLHDYWPICPAITLLDCFKKQCSPRSPALKCWICQLISRPGPKIFAQGMHHIIKRKREMAKILKQVSLFLAPSKTLQEIYLQAGMAKTKILYHPIGIDIAFARTRKTIDDPVHTPLHFGYIGTFYHHKGIACLLKAAYLLKDIPFKLTFYGDASTSLGQTCRQQVEKWGLSEKILFHGRFAPDDLSGIHQEIDVVIVPSIWLENRPLSILESFAMGNPVLGSNMGGIAELISPLPKEFLFKIGDSKSLAQRMELILSNPDLVSKARERIPKIRSIIEDVCELEKRYSQFLERTF